MKQTSYTCITDAIDSCKNQDVSHGGARIAVTHLTRKNRPVVRLTWGPRGASRRREFRDPEEAKRYVPHVISSLDHMERLERIVPPESLIKLQLALASLPGVSVEDLVASYRKQATPHTGKLVSEIVETMLLNAIHANRSKRHVQTLRSHLRKFAAAFRKPISSVTADDIQNYLRQFTNAKTYNNHRISLTCLFNFARKRGELSYDSPTAVDRVSAKKVIKADPGIPSVKSLETLLRACDHPKLRMFLLLGAFAGCRSAEILRLRWENITPEGIHLSSAVTKTGRRRIVEIPENLAAWLRTFERRKGDEKQAVSFQSQTALYVELQRLCYKTGVSWVDNGLRHGYVSHHLEKFGDPIRTSKNAGHSLRELETTYLKLVNKSTADQWFAIFPEAEATTPNRKEPNG